MTPKINLTGQRFGRLVVIAEAGRQDRKVTWLCRCDCGTESTVRGANLRSGHTTSCGCWKRERIVEASRTHGQSSSRLYKIWRGMVRRTSDPNNPDYARYGGRGISVCEDWRKSFEAFARDMGKRPEGMTLDRIDNDGNYEPSNCRWSTATEQARNKRSNRLLTYAGQTLPISVWAEHTGIRGHTISSRIRCGWSVERALTVPPQKRRVRRPQA
ncbi:hypothetical protein [Streptomyces sp. NPDC056323]|uniref:hypothetical protein n=1 Tax=Streptomyces sp. NPDC056323 TaxID=3345784 RepID=UPI0035D6A372